MPTSAQDAQKVIQQYVNAAGGTRALGQVRTVALKGNLQVPANEGGSRDFAQGSLPDAAKLEDILRAASQHLTSSAAAG